MESDAEAVAGVDLGRLAQEPLAGLVPDEGVAAAEDGEGREAVERGGEAGEGGPALLGLGPEEGEEAVGVPAEALAACDAVGGSHDEALPFACAVEMVHTFSLIHDDLPAMDDDDLRRGIPTNHRVYGEDLAILAGDALQALAFGLLADPHRAPTICPEARLAAVYELAVASGSGGLVGGQVLDLRTPPPPEGTRAPVCRRRPPS